MEENLISHESSSVAVGPESYSENPTVENLNFSQDALVCEGGQSLDPPTQNLILGKFKSVDDLSKAYQELEKRQGLQSEELGSLRQNASMLQNIQQAWAKEFEVKNSAAELRKTVEKYSSYFQDPSFQQMYREAYLAMGNKLDAEKFVNLLEGYVASRIFVHEKEKAASAENQKAIDSMSFSKNDGNSFTAPKKRLDEMTPKEVDELLERII